MSKKFHSRRYFWIIIAPLLIGLGFLFFYGYCWGLWGQGSLFLQYLFQCKCPASSEEARYPEQVDVIVPACVEGYVILSPSGRFLYVMEEKSGLQESYMFDFHLNEKIPFTPLPTDKPFYFLSDDMLFVSSAYGEEAYVMEHATPEQYPIKEFRFQYPHAYTNGLVDLDLLSQILRNAKYVFYNSSSPHFVVALPPNYEDSSTNGIFIDEYAIPGDNYGRLEEFLKERAIIYQTIPPFDYIEAVSPDERFIARKDGVYLMETGQKIVESPSARGIFPGIKYFRVKGWTFDSTKVIYEAFLRKLCLLEDFDLSCAYAVSQPVIILKVPEEYLSSQGNP